MRKTRFLCLLLVVFLLAGCREETAMEKPQEDAMEEKLAELRKSGPAVPDDCGAFYELFVYSFRDSNGDGIGDLPGVISGLDYLQDLGVDGIWLMPIHESPSYHKYDVTDYRTIDPAYGTMEDFDRLMAETEKRGIPVILDLVLNHTGDTHPWFTQAVSYLSGLSPDEEPDYEICPQAEYYQFKRADSCPPAHHPVPGAAGWYYEGQFSPHMPDVNFGCAALREEQKKIMEFWLQKGVDGFRLDAAKEFCTGQTEKNLEVLRWIRDTARTIQPDCLLVAEVWDSFSMLTDYYGSGFPSLFNFAFAGPEGKIIRTLRAAGNPDVTASYAQALEKADRAFRGQNPAYRDAPFLSNHDLGRIAGFAGRKPEQTKLAAAMNLFMSGNAFLYYGEELGMVCGAVDDPSCRAPMYWNSRGDGGMTQPPPGCTLPEEYPFGSLEDQEKDPWSVYNYYRQALAIRHGIPAISRGIPREEAGLNQGTVSACRKTWQGETCLILMNISDQPAKADLQDYGEFSLQASLCVSAEEVCQENAHLLLPPWAVAVLAVK